MKKILLNSSIVITVLIALILLGQKIIILNGLVPENSSTSQYANILSTQLITQAIIMILHMLSSVFMIIAINSKHLLKPVRKIFFSFSIIICVNGLLNIFVSIITYIFIFLRVMFFKGARE